MKIHVIAAALPPQLDGIGDYTALLSAELAKSVTVTVLTCRGAAHTPIPGVAVLSVFSVAQPRSVREIAAQVEADRPDWVLLQYQPFAYGRWGMNLHLPEAMRRIKRRCPGTKFALMMHEPFVPVGDARSAVMTTWQRWQLWRLGRAADVMFCSIDPWARRFQRWFPGTPVLHLPVGSNIPLVPTARAEARARLGIADGTLVFGLFGTAHHSRLLQPVRDAVEAVAQAGHNALVLYMGPQGGAVRVALGAGTRILDDGPLPPEEVSRRFAALDVYFAAYADGISTRRGALMAGLQQGAAIVGTYGPLTDPVLQREDGRAFLLAPSDAPTELTRHVLHLVEDAPLRGRLGCEAQRLYRAEFAWERIAERLLDALNPAQFPQGVSAAAPVARK